MFSVTEEMWLELRLQIRSLQIPVYSWQAVTWAFRSKMPEADLQADVICRIYVANLEQVLGTSEYSRDEELEHYEDLVAIEKSYFESLLEELPEHRSRIDLDRDVIFEILEPNEVSSRRICYFQGDDVFWDD